MTLQGCDLSHHNGEHSAPLLDFAIVRVSYGMPDGRTLPDLAAEGHLDRLTSDGKPRVLIDLESVAGLATEKTPARARIALRKIDERPAPGSRISVKAKLTTLPSPVAPGSFDFARAAWFRGVGAYGYALGPPTGGQLLALGTLTDFACTVKPASCQPSDALALVNAHLAQIDAMNAAEITSATVRPFYDGCYLNSGRNLDAEMSRLDTDSLVRASANRKRGSNRRNAEILEERFGINPDGSDRREMDVRYELVYADGMVIDEVQSSPSGTWQVANLDPALKYDVIGRLFMKNDVIVSGVAPKVDGEVIPSYSELILSHDPVGYWRLGEASGTVAQDLGGNGGQIVKRDVTHAVLTPERRERAADGLRYAEHVLEKHVGMQVRPGDAACLDSHDLVYVCGCKAADKFYSD